MYNVTKFLEDHPGGKDIVLEQAGKDTSDVFEEAGHSSEARDILPKLLVGRLDGPHNVIQTFDTVVSGTAKAEEAKGPYMRTILQVAFPSTVFILWAYTRDGVSAIGLPSWQGLGGIDRLWTSVMVILLVVVIAFFAFVRSVIYVDFGRLDKYPSRIRLRLE